MFSKQYAFRSPNIKEGGNSRLNAILELCKEDGTKQTVYGPSNNFVRALFCFHFIASLLRCSEEVILVHYSIFPSLFSQRISTNLIFLRILTMVLNHAGRRNTIYIEVNDLPYEQSIDLELPPNKMFLFDRKIYRLNYLSFVFASHGMADYVCKTYNTPHDHCSVLINGGPSPENFKPKPQQPTRLRFVYVGTLNPGRQIEDMIRAFKGSPHILYLLGENGSWIADSPLTCANIQYLGAYDEARAHAFVGTCDIGLIPYNQSRMYYNLCYPTKASFYITAGIPFLSTELAELQRHFDDSHAIFCKLDDWPQVIARGDFSLRVVAMTPKVLEVSGDFLWRTVWKKWLTSLARQHTH